MTTPKQNTEEAERIRSVVTKAVVICIAVAIAPWLTGGQEPLAMLISGFALLLGSLLIWRQPASRVLARGPLVWLFAAFMGLGLLSLLWTASTFSTWTWLMQWLLAGLVFRLSYAIAGEERGRYWLLMAYLVSAAIFSVIGLWFFLTGTYGRLTGTFYWANPAAAYLLPAILISLERARQSRGRKWWLWGATAVGFLAVFLLADSRGATLALIGSAILYLLLVKIKKTFWIKFLFILILGYVLSIGITSMSKMFVHQDRSGFGSRFAEVITGESTSGNDRIYYLQSAFDMWFSRPLGGVGAGAYGDVHPQFQQGPSRASTNAHNEYAQVLAELGLSGAILLAALVLVLIACSLRGLIDRPDMMVVAVSTVGLLVHFGLDIDARYPALLGLIAMFFGLMYAQRDRPWRKGGLGWPVLAILVLIPVILSYESEVWAERGRAAQADGKYLDAADDFRAARMPVVSNPDYIGAQGINLYTAGLLNAADAKSLQGQALEMARLAQKFDPHDAQHHQLEGRVLLAQRNPKGAEAAFREALRIDGQNHPDHASDLAGALIAQGKPDEAVDVARAMLAQYPEAVRVRRLSDETLPPRLANLESLVGIVALQKGSLDEAEAAADRALRIDQNNLRAKALKRQARARRAEVVAQVAETERLRVEAAAAEAATGEAAQ